MIKNLFIAVFLSLTINANATQIVYPTSYAPTGQVTNVNLNSNFNAASSVVNGKLDNTNADTINGYRFYQTVAVLPSAGSQGSVYFLTSDNSLNFDTGSTFTKSVSVSSPSANQVPVYNGSSWTPTNISALGNYVPSGVILMWHGTIATIPTGYYLCDGTNGTPDLRNRFIVAANADSGGVAKSTITGSAAQTGGSTTITAANVTALKITINQTNPASNTGGNNSVQGVAATGSLSPSALTEGSATAYTQPFYALAYIMKS